MAPGGRNPQKSAMARAKRQAQMAQEGKGGGLGQALGGHAQSTFGVAASGITRFTGVLAAVFLGSALLIHICQGKQSMGVDVEGLGVNVEAPADGE